MSAAKTPTPRHKPRLTRAERKQLAEISSRARRDKKVPHTAQDTIPYQRMWPDGICRVTDTYYTRTIQYQDINYQLAMNEDKTSIFDGWCDFLNYFDPSIRFQFSFLNLSTKAESFEDSIRIPAADDAFNAIRTEYETMLLNQLAKGNNGLTKTKYITFGIEADGIKTAKARLNRIELDILTNFKKLGVRAESLDGRARLELMHRIFHMDSPDRFMFDWNWLPSSGLSTKDFIAPSSFEFRNSRIFSMGKKVGSVSFLQILAPELNDRMLADFLDLESSLIVTMHVQPLDQTEAIRMIKRKITDLDKSKIDEQKKAVRAGYDMDIIPSDLATYGSEAKRILQDLQSRNEKMFLVTFLLMNTADNKRQLDINRMAAQGIAQQYNCQLTQLDFQQENAMVSSLPLGLNKIHIQRALTTSSTAIFVPFTTQELFQQEGEPLYYGLNALSRNLIMVDRKKLKNPNGLILGTPGCLAGETQILLADGRFASFEKLVKDGIQEAWIDAYDELTHEVVEARAIDIRIERYVHDLYRISLVDGTIIRCTDRHLIMDAEMNYIEARDIVVGTQLSGQLEVIAIDTEHYDEPVPVYDLTVPGYLNFLLPNGLIVHNSGKSFSAKREMTNVFLSTKDDMRICDPEGEYSPVVNSMEGQVIRISPTSTDYINPMDINLDYSDGENPLSLKSDFILSLFELIIGGREGLKPIEKTVIDRAVRQVYQPYLNDPVPENVPLLEDLYFALMEQEEREAHTVATALEIYVSGSLNVFNHRTNVDVNNRVVCYDIKELGSQLKKIGMLIVQDQIWGCVTANRSEGKCTWVWIDEMHLLLQEEQTAAYTVAIWKRFRKWGGVPTGITQNAKDLLSSPEVQNIFENSDFIIMLNQGGGDRQILAKQLNISPHQLSYVTQSGAGEGLLFYGNVILPFVDHFPKDTLLYRLMTTKLEEVNHKEEPA